MNTPILQERANVILHTLHNLFPQVSCSLRYATDWQLLVAVMLSAQCTDRQVNRVTAQLFQNYPSFSAFATITEQDLQKEIFSTGFYRQKAKHIRAAIIQIQDQFHGKVPRSMDALLSLPGVARKTANVVLGELYGIVDGIAVDTHVRRLSKLYGLTMQDDPVNIEKELMAIIPKNEWREFTLRMIEYGRRYCPARKHNHAQCPLTQALVVYRSNK